MRPPFTCIHPLQVCRASWKSTPLPRWALSTGCDRRPSHLSALYLPLLAPSAVPTNRLLHVAHYYYCYCCWAGWRGAHAKAQQVLHAHTRSANTSAPSCRVLSCCLVMCFALCRHGSRRGRLHQWQAPAGCYIYCPVPLCLYTPPPAPTPAPPWRRPTLGSTLTVHPFASARVARA